MRGVDAGRSPAAPVRYSRLDVGLAVLSHVAFWMAIIVGPLLLWLVCRRKSLPLGRHHAAAAFNFQVLWVPGVGLFGLVNEALSSVESDVLYIPLLVTFLAAIGLVFYGVYKSAQSIIRAASGQPPSYPAVVSWLR